MAERHLIGSVQVTAGSFDASLALVVQAARTDNAEHVHFVNAYTIALAAGDPEYAKVLNDGLCFTDGVPVAWVGRRAYGSSAETWPRVYGPDVMAALLESDLRHYLLGSTPATLQTLQDVIACRWPQAAIVGAHSPPFRPLTDTERDAQDAAIRNSGAQLVWLGLGTPKQDWEAARVAVSTGLTTLAVGAAFDFIAGTKPQAPRWMQRSGVEWGFRLASEPRRLAKRYLWGNPRFMMAVAREPGFRKPRA